MADTISCTTCDAECREICEATCKSTADSRTILEIDSNGNLCGCGSSCNSICGDTCEGTSKSLIIDLSSKVEVPDVTKVRYGDSDIIDKSKNKFM